MQMSVWEQGFLLTSWNEMTGYSNIGTNKAFAFAAKNQFVFDCFYYSLLGLPSEKFNGLPRPSKWANRGKNVRKLLRLFSLPFAFFWSYFFCYIYILFEFTTCLIQRKRVNLSATFESKFVAYAVCDRACVSILQACENKDSLFWLVPPKCELSRKVEESLGASAVHVASILSVGDILRSCMKALAAHYYLVKKNGARLGLQSYALPEWMLTYAATNLISPGKIFIAEHHDRWAVMADSYCTDMKESGKDCSVELVQHGLEYRETYEKIDGFTAGEGLPYRLRSVASIYVYNEEQLHTFKKNILCERLGNATPLQVNYLKHEIKLGEIKASDFSILFVGHPICRTFHISLLRALKKKTTAVCFYKPHPAAKEKHEIQGVDWIVIDDPGFFPKVDLVVAYPSTLVNEYATHEIPSVVHDIQAEAVNVQSILEKIMNVMKSGMPSK